MANQAELCRTVANRRGSRPPRTEPWRRGAVRGENQTVGVTHGSVCERTAPRGSRFEPWSTVINSRSWLRRCTLGFLMWKHSDASLFRSTGPFLTSQSWSYCRRFSPIACRKAACAAVSKPNTSTSMRWYICSCRSLVRFVAYSSCIEICFS